MMLASGADFRYSAMVRNRRYLLSKGWKVKWIEFEGGHTIAPVDCYEQALKFFDELSSR